LGLIVLAAAFFSLAASAQGQELLANGDFDTGPGVPWVEAGPFPLIVEASSLPGGAAPHSGMYASWLGGVLDTNDSLQQAVLVPSLVTGLTLTGQRQIQTAEVTTSIAFDTVSVTLRTTTGGLIASLAIWSNLDASSGWVPFTLPVASPESLAGQTVLISFTSQNDLSNVTNFLFDSLSFEAAVPPALPSLSGWALLGLIVALAAVTLPLLRAERREYLPTI
jgi:xanthomonalisin